MNMYRIIAENEMVAKSSDVVLRILNKQKAEHPAWGKPGATRKAKTPLPRQRAGISARQARAGAKNRLTARWPRNPLVR